MERSKAIKTVEQLIPKRLLTKLKKNYEKNVKAQGALDHVPVVKLFGGSSATWLITEYDAKSNCFFGLADLGMGFPEVGWTHAGELMEVKFPPLLLGVQRDALFSTTYTLSQWMSVSIRLGHIPYTIDTYYQ